MFLHAYDLRKEGRLAVRALSPKLPDLCLMQSILGMLTLRASFISSGAW